MILRFSFILVLFALIFWLRGKTQLEAPREEIREIIVKDPVRARQLEQAMTRATEIMRVPERPADHANDGEVASSGESSDSGGELGVDGPLPEELKDLLRRGESDPQAAAEDLASQFRDVDPERRDLRAQYLETAIKLRVNPEGSQALQEMAIKQLEVSTGDNPTDLELRLVDLGLEILLRNMSDTRDRARLHPQIETLHPSELVRNRLSSELLGEGSRDENRR